jgi:hypothetical protein
MTLFTPGIQQAATTALSACPAVRVFGKVTPSAKVEIAHAKVGVFGEVQRFL